MTERDKLAELIRDGQPISMSAEDIADAIIAAGWRAPEPQRTAIHTDRRTQPRRHTGPLPGL